MMTAAAIQALREICAVCEDIAGDLDKSGGTGATIEALDLLADGIHKRIKDASHVAGLLPGKSGSVRASNLAARAVAKEWGITIKELLGPSRSMRLVDARAAVAALLREAGYSYPEIGKIIGRDHSSVFHGLKRREENQEWVARVVVARETAKQFTKSRTADEVSR
jgi:hypothetical protein